MNLLSAILGNGWLPQWWRNEGYVESAWGSALLAGVLSFASPKESSQRKGDPWVGARCAGSLRYSASRAACLNSPAAQTRQADCPRPTCVAQHLSRGPVKRPVLKRLGCHSRAGGNPSPAWTPACAGVTGIGQVCVTPRCLQFLAFFQVDCSSQKVGTVLDRGRLSGPVWSAEQRRRWRKKGEDCLRA